jgi:hypothetical protein
MRIQTHPAIAATAAAAIALTSAHFAPAAAGPAPKQIPPVVQAGEQAGEMEFSSRKRTMSRGDRAMLGAVLGVFGTIASVAAANAARNRHYRGHPHHHYYGPAPYPPPYHYGHRRYYYYYR